MYVNKLKLNVNYKLLTKLYFTKAEKLKKAEN